MYIYIYICIYIYQEAAPALVEACRALLEQFVRDEAEAASYPLPRARTEQVVCVCCHPAPVHTHRHTRTHKGECSSVVTTAVASARAAHVLLMCC